MKCRYGPGRTNQVRVTISTIANDTRIASHSSAPITPNLVRFVGCRTRMKNIRLLTNPIWVWYPEDRTSS